MSKDNKKELFWITSAVSSGDRSFVGVDLFNSCDDSKVKVCSGDSCDDANNDQQVQDKVLVGDLNNINTD